MNYDNSNSNHQILPPYEVSPELKKYTLLFIGVILINILIAGSCAIGMRIIQADVPLLNNIDTAKQNILYYSLLTSHGQVMFFGVASMLTMVIGYYATSKWSRKPISGFTWAKISLWVMEAAVILIFITNGLGLGVGWYNLMPLIFMSGSDMAWGYTASFLFLIADLLVGISLSIFCIVILFTLLKGSLPVGTQKYEEFLDQEKSITEINKSDDDYDDHTHYKNLVPSLRWIALLGISSWFPRRFRLIFPAVPIILVGIFITALMQISANPGLFLQLANGFIAIQDPVTASNWLLTKDAWWFFAHPIVYFVLLISLASLYVLIPRYTNEPTSYSKWNYRPWPFYFIFSLLVFSHHVFMDMPNPVWLQMLSQTASLGIVFPSGLTLITVLMHMWRKHISWNVTTKFLLAGLAGWVLGGLQGAETGMWGADLYQHNTMAIPGHIHLIVFLGPVLIGFGLIYAILPDLVKRNTDKTLAEIHFWLTIFGGFGFALLFTLIGMDGAVRREANMPGAFDWAMPWLLFMALLAAIGQLIFFYNIINTIVKSHRLHLSKSGIKLIKYSKE